MLFNLVLLKLSTKREQTYEARGTEGRYEAGRQFALPSWFTLTISGKIFY